MLVLALQFSKDGPDRVPHEGAGLEGRSMGRGSRGMDREEEGELPHNGTGTPDRTGSGGAATSPQGRPWRVHGVGCDRTAE